MAYTAASLVPQFDGGSGFGKRWSYTTADSLATVMASGYFTGRSASSANGDGLSIGDIIDVHIVNAVAIASRTSATGVFQIMVATNDGTTVTTQVVTAAGVGGVVDTTATTLTITQALHAGRTVTVSSAAPIAITLPAATGSGSKYKFVVTVAATATSHTIKVANTVDIMTGIAYTESTATTTSNTTSYKTTATDDTVTLNGTTLGGVVGDYVTVEDIKSGVFLVRVESSPTGTTATPFSATV